MDVRCCWGKPAAAYTLQTKTVEMAPRLPPPHRGAAESRPHRPGARLRPPHELLCQPSPGDLLAGAEAPSLAERPSSAELLAGQPSSADLLRHQPSSADLLRRQPSRADLLSVSF